MKIPDLPGAGLFTIPLLKNIQYLILLDKECVEKFGQDNDIGNESCINDYDQWGATTTCMVHEGNHYFVMTAKDLNIGTFVHESVHLAQLILEFHGINTDKRNTEILAYTTDHIFGVMHDFWKEYKKVKK